MMRIRHILPPAAEGTLPRDPTRAPMTGAVGAAWQFAVQQAADGDDVQVVAPSVGARPHQARVAGVNVVWLPTLNLLRHDRLDLSYLLPLTLWSLTARAVDIAHVHAGPFFVPLAGRRARATILHYQASLIRASSRYDEAVKAANAVICCSQFIRDQVLAATGRDPASVHVVNNGVHRARFAPPSARARVEARAAHNLIPDEVAIAYVGRISEDKGLLTLVDALTELRRRHCPVPTLLVAGAALLGYEGYPAAWAKLRAYERLVHERARDLPVRFLGSVGHADLPAIYWAADIFVCPSVFAEPFGMVNAEAAAAGLPVVASNVGGIPEALQAEQTGLLVPPSDPLALADALERLTADPRLRERLGQAGQRFARRFDWPVLTDEISTIYRLTLGVTGNGRQLRAAGGPA